MCRYGKYDDKYGKKDDKYYKPEYKDDKYYKEEVGSCSLSCLLLQDPPA